MSKPGVDKHDPGTWSWPPARCKHEKCELGFRANRLLSQTPPVTGERHFKLLDIGKVRITLRGSYPKGTSAMVTVAWNTCVVLKYSHRGLMKTGREDALLASLEAVRHYMVLDDLANA